ncbi:hypothetical protein CGMCC3_g1141 [Colletotrichum fructicola]|uniref:Uncharacterized protein n=1 Tax=Colletotrichum fructicola (strain Nara gc5) TaxID=1213859 RepID=A0A7J6IW26_COLFN|nr:uncharacterized protein CGMCC3_g1141 [Colletotrichum fructicola]KAF4481303.1 hypothetical protein CGGC5_v010841 [Colletotrichum fructicola Nara gc5]KAF4869295.1 hypothetical protein CGCSCA1_v011543 [Colletotrichum siamense]KAE9582763.1 hypothetical protein CGMCC3_g1141 [Colletotrichum fructicola]KAF4412857.1 hypothetical protein CFRS1_v002533 [Colletotrichum fructicola]KAF4902137.1 hypothetical protein CGCFRS4_v002373 [Colletotrichum fructicola]
MEVSDIKSYHIRREVLEAWLRATFPGAAVEVVPRDGEYSILAPRVVTQKEVKPLKNLKTWPPPVKKK